MNPTNSIEAPNLSANATKNTPVVSTASVCEHIPSLRTYLSPFCSSAFVKESFTGNFIIARTKLDTNLDASATGLQSIGFILINVIILRLMILKLIILRFRNIHYLH